MVSVSGRLAQVRYAEKRGMSCTKACMALRVSRSMLRYQRRQPDKDAQLLRRLPITGTGVIKSAHWTCIRLNLAANGANRAKCN
jgi:hypothetical protein